MRNSDRTYLQALGFQDQDKNNPLHDQACVYLAQPDKVQKFALMFDRDGPLVPRLSAPLYVSEGHYRAPRLLGYADLLLEENFGNHTAVVIVEVKAGRSSLPNIIQQLKTYQRFSDGIRNAAEIVLATLYRLSENEKKLLRDEGFLHIYLDPQQVLAAHAELVKKQDETPAF